MKKHAVIIRFHYPDGHPDFSWRFAYFQAMVLPRLLAQTNKDFDICVRINPASEVHKVLFELLSPRIKTFSVKPEAEHRIKPGYEAKAKRYFVDFVDWEDVVGLEKYEIQTALDSDDLILKDDFIDLIETNHRIQCNYHRAKSSYITFQPLMFDVEGLKMYIHKMRYSIDRGAPIYSIAQSVDDPGYIFVYSDSHLKIGRQFGAKTFYDESLCAMSVHKHNASSYLFPNSKLA